MQKILVIVWIEGGFKTTIFFKYGEGRRIHCIYTRNCGADWNEYCVLKDGLYCYEQMMIFTLLLRSVRYVLISQCVLSLFEICCHIRDLIMLKTIRDH